MKLETLAKVDVMLGLLTANLAFIYSCGGTDLTTGPAIGIPLLVITLLTLGIGFKFEAKAKHKQVCGCMSFKYLRLAADVLLTVLAFLSVILGAQNDTKDGMGAFFVALGVTNLPVIDLVADGYLISEGW